MTTDKNTMDSLTAYIYDTMWVLPGESTIEFFVGDSVHPVVLTLPLHNNPIRSVKETSLGLRIQTVYEHGLFVCPNSTVGARSSPITDEMVVLSQGPALNGADLKFESLDTFILMKSSPVYTDAIACKPTAVMWHNTRTPSDLFKAIRSRLPMEIHMRTNASGFFLRACNTDSQKVSLSFKPCGLSSKLQMRCNNQEVQGLAPAYEIFTTFKRDSGIADCLEQCLAPVCVQKPCRLFQVMGDNWSKEVALTEGLYDLKTVADHIRLELAKHGIRTRCTNGRLILEHDKDFSVLGLPEGVDPERPIMMPANFSAHGCRKVGFKLYSQRDKQKQGMVYSAHRLSVKDNCLFFTPGHTITSAPSLYEFGPSKVPIWRTMTEPYKCLSSRDASSTKRATMTSMVNDELTILQLLKNGQPCGVDRRPTANGWLMSFG